MKKQDLIDLGIAEDVAEKVFALHDKGLEPFKTKLSTAETEVKGLKDQLKEASTQIESFKGLDIEGVKKSADEWKAKAETAQAEAAKQLAALKFDHALEGALSAAKVKNPRAVKALIDSNGLKFNETDGSIIGLDDQLKKVKESDAYLFSDETPTPRIVAGGNNQPVVGNPSLDAARMAAGLVPKK